MSDWGTVRAATTDEWNLDATGDADDFLDRAIAQTLVHLRPLPFTFNIGNFILETVIGQSAYPKSSGTGQDANKLPGNFWGIIGHRITLDPNQTGTQVRNLTETDAGEFFQIADQTIHNRIPDRYTFWDETVHINPPPQSVDDLSGRYIQDLGTPTPKFESGGSPEWTYLDRDGSAVDTDTFTNEWFTRAFDVMVARVAAQYFTRHERNVKNKAAAQEAYSTAMKELRREAAPLLTVGSMKPFMGGYEGVHSGRGRRFHRTI